MSFQPNPGDELIINDEVYVVGSHPAAPGLAYAQAGRQGIVYQLLDKSGAPHKAKALKVFFSKFRIPAMVYQSEHMELYGEIPGLQVCKRDVLTPERNGDLITKQPDLLYAVLMPWVYGKTWFDCLTEQSRLEPSDSLVLARSLAAIGSAMEQRGLAHCDLSAPNVMIPFFSEVELPEGVSPVELVDVEQMYSTKMDRPDTLLAGSPGYAAHRTVHSGLWSAYADRFAGAVIIAEMLGWSDPTVVDRAWGESYFDQLETQTPCERYYILRKSLESRWGTRLSDLFVRAWESQDLSSCPTFGEWLVVLNSLSHEQIPSTEQAEPELKETTSAAAIVAGAETLSIGISAPVLEGTRGDKDIIDRLFREARELEEANKPAAALEVYRSLYHFAEEGSPLQVEVLAAIQGLEELLHPPLPAEPVKPAWYRSRKVMISAAAAIVVLAGSIPAVQILADRANTKQLEAVKLAEEQKKQEAQRQMEEAARLKAEEERKAEELALAQKKAEEEKAKQAAAAARQAKYEAYLASKEKQKQEASKQELQTKYERQAKYEEYLTWKKERDERLAAEAAAEEKRKAETAAAAAKAAVERKGKVLQLISLYNKAYSSQEGGREDKARSFAIQFTQLYETNSSYFHSVGEMGYRASALYKYLSESDYRLPSI
ncbi:hypothetical protein OIN60_11660 [Paenibacillus sp. P96]|uniref:Protein kinase domain-containing protein n=1 Tax=Paenibacillus zeirhizosphaerae TaxID=2987519 RepID=A0ABT9FRR8_9BACL|nr:hypothetical protein [Paenibacillus sp. P96]MDP4097426.1 hypothetical protein [Paenibacillus sp. P96]